MTKLRVVGVFVAAIVLAGAAWIVLRDRSAGAQRVAESLGDVGCPLEVNAAPPGSSLRTRKDVVDAATVGCQPAALGGVDYLRFRSTAAAAASMRSVPGRDAYCITKAEVVIAFDVFQPDFRRMCRRLQGHVVVPSGYRWVTPQG